MTDPKESCRALPLSRPHGGQAPTTPYFGRLVSPPTYLSVHSCHQYQYLL